MSADDVLIDLISHFSLLSLLSFGGVGAVIPEMHRYLVESAHLLTNEQFATFYSISAAAPGPNMLYVALFGWQAAGVPGALLSTVAMAGPSSLLAVAYAALSDRRGRAVDKAWVRLVREGLAPISVGLVLSTGWVLARQFDGAFARPWLPALVTAVTVVVLLRTRLHPLWLIAAGAALGASGLLA